MRVLVWGMQNNLGGTEAVIENIVSSLNGRIDFDFIVYEGIPNHRDVLVGTNRAVIVPAKRRDYRGYRAAMEQYFEDNSAQYDAVWSNLNILNNIDVLKLAYEHGIPRRILHAHSTGNEGALHQRILNRMNRRTIDEYVNERWACSRSVGNALFGNKLFTVVPNAIDMGKYAFDGEARQRVREELDLGDRFVVGAIGRLAPIKNHGFLLRATAELVKEDPRAALVIAGEGELLGSLSRQAEQLGINDNVVFPGPRSDVPALLSAFDVYAMPSHFEGVPVSFIEAQASGIPCIVSSAIGDEAIISGAVEKLATDSPEAWAKALLHAPCGRFAPDEELASRYDLARLGDFMASLFGIQDAKEHSAS